jgi:hypothetical protein
MHHSRGRQQPPGNTTLETVKHLKPIGAIS